MASSYVAFCANSWSMCQSKCIRINDSMRQVLDRELLLRKSWAWSCSFMSPLQGSLSIIEPWWNGTFKAHQNCPIYDKVHFRFRFEHHAWAHHVEERINETDLEVLREQAHQPHQGAQFLATITLQAVNQNGNAQHHADAVQEENNTNETAENPENTAMPHQDASNTSGVVDQ